jgi:hypothetical protein
VLQQVVLAETHPLSSAITALFVAERQRVDRLIQELRDLAKHLSNRIDGAWIQGGIAADEDRPGEPITLAVLAPTSSTSTLSKSLREAVTPIEVREDVTLDTKIYTRPDLLTLSAEEKKSLSHIVQLYGSSPALIVDGRPTRNISKKVSLHSHREAEQRQLAEAVVRHLRRNPAKRRLALEFIARRWKDASPRERHELEEWKTFLESASHARLERLLTDPGERATRLRQTLPFMNLLTPDERDRLLAEIRNDAR